MHFAMSKPPAPSDVADKFMLRMPDGMRDRLREEAARNGRSMNSEIVARLEQSFRLMTPETEMPAITEVTLAIMKRLEKLSDAELARILKSDHA